MDFFDLYVPAEEKAEEVVKLAEDMDFSGIGISHIYKGKEGLNDYLEKMDDIDSKTEIDIIRCCAIEPESPEEMESQVGKIRQKVELVAVKGGNFDVNRAAVEDRRIDILLHPEYKRKDSGIDHKTAKAASENDVTIGLVFHTLHQTYGKVRSHVLRHMKKSIQLCNKYGANITVVSGAEDKYSIKEPRELASLLRVLDVEPPESMRYVSYLPEGIVKTNRKKLKGEIKKGGVEEF